MRLKWVKLVNCVWYFTAIQKADLVKEVSTKMLIVMAKKKQN